MAQRVILNNQYPTLQEETGHVYSLVNTPTLVNCYPEPKSPDESSFYPRGCKDVWNENKNCTADDSYYQPLAEGDDLIIQTRFYDDVNFSIGDDSCKGIGFNEAYWEFEILNNSNIIWGERKLLNQCSCNLLTLNTIVNRRNYAVPIIVQGSNTGTVYLPLSRYHTIDIGCSDTFEEYAQKFFDVYFSLTSFASAGCDPTPFNFRQSIKESSVELSPTKATFKLLFNRDKLEMILPAACGEGLSIKFIKLDDNGNAPGFNNIDGPRCCDANASCYLFGPDGCIGELPTKGEPVKCDNSLSPGTGRYGLSIFDIPGVVYNQPLDDFGRNHNCANPVNGFYLAAGVRLTHNCMQTNMPAKFDEPFQCSGFPQATVTWKDYNYGFAAWLNPTNPAHSYGMTACATDFEDYADRVITYFTIDTSVAFGGTTVLNITKTPITAVIEGNNRAGYAIEFEYVLNPSVQACYCNGNPRSIFTWYHNPIVEGTLAAPIFDTNPTCSFKNPHYLAADPAAILLFDNQRRYVTADNFAISINRWEVGVPNPAKFPLNPSFIPNQAGAYWWQASLPNYEFLTPGVGIEDRPYPIITDVFRECCPIDRVEGSEGFAKFEFTTNFHTLIYGSDQDLSLVDDFAIFIPWLSLNCELFSYDTVPIELKASNYPNYLSYATGITSYWNLQLANAGSSGTVSFSQDALTNNITFIFLLDVTNFTLEYGYNPCEAAIPICVYHSDKYAACTDGFREVLLNLRAHDNFSSEVSLRMACGGLELFNVTNTTFNSPNSNPLLDAIVAHINTNHPNSSAAAVGRTQLRIHFAKADFPEFCSCTGGLSFNTTILSDYKIDLLYDSGACCVPRKQCNFSIDGYIGYPVDYRGSFINPLLTLGAVDPLSIRSFSCWSGEDLSTISTTFGTLTNAVQHVSSPSYPTFRHFVDAVVLTNNSALAATNSDSSIAVPWWENGVLKGIIYYIKESLLPACGCGKSVIAFEISQRPTATNYNVVSDRSLCCDAQDCDYPDAYIVHEFTLEDPGVYNGAGGTREGCFNVFESTALCPLGCNPADFICLSESSATNFNQYKVFVVKQLTLWLRLYFDPNATVVINGTAGRIVFNKGTYNGNCNTDLKVCELDCSNVSDGGCDGAVTYEMDVLGPDVGPFTNDEGNYDMSMELLNCAPSPLYLSNQPFNVYRQGTETWGAAIVRVFNTVNPPANDVTASYLPGVVGFSNDKIIVRVGHKILNLFCDTAPCHCDGDLNDRFGNLLLRMNNSACKGEVSFLLRMITGVGNPNRFTLRYFCTNTNPIINIIVPLNSSVPNYSATTMLPLIQAAAQSQYPNLFVFTYEGLTNPALHDYIRITVPCTSLLSLCQASGGGGVGEPPISCDSYDESTNPIADHRFTGIYSGTLIIANSPLWLIYSDPEVDCNYIPAGIQGPQNFIGPVTDCDLVSDGVDTLNVDIDFSLDNITPICCVNNVAEPPPGQGTAYTDQEVIITEPDGPNPLCCPPVIGTVSVQDCCCGTYTGYTFDQIVAQQLISIDNDIPTTFQNFKINWGNLPDCFSLRFATATSEYVTDCFKKDKCQDTIKLCAKYPDGFVDCRGNVYGLGDDPCEETLDDEGEGLRFQPCVRLWGSFTLAEISIDETSENKYSAKSSSEKWRLLTLPIPAYVVRQLENLFVAPYVQDEAGRQFKMINQITQNIEGSSMWHLDILLERIDDGCAYDASCLEIVVD